MSDNYAFVDIQGFKSNTNRFVVKEIAIITQNITFHDIVKSTPSAFSDLDAAHKKQAKWLTYNFHGLKWDWGFVTLQELRKQIEPILSGKIIYVKGDEKIHWLRQILGFEWRSCHNIIDIETFNCALCLSINNGNTYQNFKIKNHLFIKHATRCHCTLKNVHILEKWFQQNQESVKSELSQTQTQNE